MSAVRYGLAPLPGPACCHDRADTVLAREGSAFVRIAFLIRALGLGGAERQMVYLATGLAQRGHQVVVFAFYAGLPDRERSLNEGGVELVLLGKRGRWDVCGFVAGMRAALIRHAPDVLYSFLPSSNVIAALVRPRHAPLSLVWGVRASNVRRDSYDWLGWLISHIERWMAGVPEWVVANSLAGLNLCLERGFRPARLSYVPNGVDTELFRLDPLAGSGLRAKWDLSGLIIGFAGRLDPMKGLGDLLTALSRADGALARANLVIAGGGSERYTSRLQAQAAELGLARRVHWLGPVGEMTAFYNAIDILCLPSAYGEGTSNVLAEALACGCPCVATAVGDSAALVEFEPFVACPEDSADLLRALTAAVGLIPGLQRDALRTRISDKLAWPAVIRETERVLLQAVDLRRNFSGADGASP